MNPWTSSQHYEIFLKIEAVIKTSLIWPIAINSPFKDISEHVDWSKAKRPNLEQKRVNLDLPKWMIDRLDYEAKRIGVARQAIMKMFLAERLEHDAS